MITNLYNTYLNKLLPFFKAKIKSAGEVNHKTHISASFFGYANQLVFL